MAAVAAFVAGTAVGIAAVEVAFVGTVALGAVGAGLGH